MCFLPCQVAELLVGVPAPIMYWEQGHEWLFGDPVRFQVCDTAHTRSQLIVQQRSAVCHRWGAASSPKFSACQLCCHVCLLIR